jgi:hypothetical protein
MSDVEIMAAVIIGIAGGVILGAFVASRPPTKRVKVDPTLDYLRRLADVARERRLTADVPRLPAGISADLSEVLSLLDGPARDSEVVRIARDRLDDVRRTL